ncbi:hypothetical protein ACQJBY_054996 [Aegilops geniculata]
MANDGAVSAIPRLPWAIRPTRATPGQTVAPPPPSPRRCSLPHTHPTPPSSRRSRGHRPPFVAPRCPEASSSSSPSSSNSESSREGPYARHRARRHCVHHRHRRRLPPLRPSPAPPTTAS